MTVFLVTFNKTHYCIVSKLKLIQFRFHFLLDVHFAVEVTEKHKHEGVLNYNYHRECLRIVAIIRQADNRMMNY